MALNLGSGEVLRPSTFGIECRNAIAFRGGRFGVGVSDKIWNIHREKLNGIYDWRSLCFAVKYRNVEFAEWKLLLDLHIKTAITITEWVQVSSVKIRYLFSQTVALSRTGMFVNGAVMWRTKIYHMVKTTPCNVANCKSKLSRYQVYSRCRK